MDNMKRYLNYLYTDAAKILVLLSGLVLVWFSGDNALKTIVFYREDPAATLNAIVQGDDFDYETSVFLRYEITQAIENVLTYSLEYSADSYTQGGQELFSNVSEALSSYKDFRFAIVNHTDKKIVSNIPEIDAKPSDTKIRRYFGEAGKSLLIVRDTHNPYYEKGTMTEYVSVVQKLSQSYHENFDLYISFPEDFVFAGEESEYIQRHEEMLGRMEKYVALAVSYFLCSFFTMSFLVFIAGKKRVNGRIYMNAMDRIPNDVMILFYLIVIISLLALLENGVYMMIQTTDHEDFWLHISPGFYSVRIKASITGLMATVTAFACTVKRQAKNKSLITNTYIYKLVRSYRPEKQVDR